LGLANLVDDHGGFSHWGLGFWYIIWV
jgi:hypothetical protein